MKACGATLTEIGKALSLPVSTVHSTCKADPLRDEGRSRPRAGRPKSWTPAEERLLLRHVRRNPNDTCAEIIAACGLALGRTTVNKILAEHGVRK